MARHSSSQVIKRMTVFFLIVFAVTSIGDVWSTELGQRLPNTVELNPLGFLPLHLSILGELAIGAVGCLLVAIGAALSADTLAGAKDSGFFDFLSRFQSRFPVFILVFAPIAIAESRVIAIVNNVSILAWGESPINSYALGPIATWTGLPDSQALVVMLAAAGVMAYVPIMWTIYLAAGRRKKKAA